MRIYLDNCCYNRPYDNQTQFRVLMEAQAKLYIQDAVKRKRFELVDSFMLQKENEDNPDDMRKTAIKSFRERYSSFYVPHERMEQLQESIKKALSYGIKYKDAVHTACAIYARCDCLLTTDDSFMKRYKGNEIRIMNPLQFIQETEEGASV